MNWASTEPYDEVPLVGRGFMGRDALLTDVRTRLVTSRGFAIATLNLDHAVKLRRMPTFREAYSAHTHVVADGNPIVWMERLAGRRAELVPGSDLVQPLAQIAAEANVPLALIGSTDVALKGASRALCHAAPGLSVGLTHAPSATFDPFSAEADRIIEAVRKSGAGLCMLALGAPKQELFAARLRRILPALGVLSVGAGLDFLAGSQNRAPRIVRSVAMEWAWRLLNDPRRLAGRYALCASLLPILSLEALRFRWSAAPTRQHHVES
ncbi:MAG: WecB/TagA/CpsF family glycosyltransferase [Pseudomonadota bacterium]